MVFAQTQTENYIKTKTYKVATTTSILSPTITQANQNVTYFDGLGRPIQQIAHRQSGSGKDIVTPIEYDGFGHQEKDYLPYVPTATASLNYKTTALIDVGTFYKSTTYENTLNPYSKKEFEASPLNRVIKQAAPGNDWAIGSGHEIKLDYQTNTSADIVKLFSVPAIWDATKGLYDIPTSLTPTDYLDYQLFKTITKNENWISGNDNTAEEFKNKEGQVVLKRTYDNSISHDTYYIYDQYSNLTFVIPPLVNTSNNITQTILDGLCYQYKYDSRNRLVEKKLPGKQWEFIVYDKLDRVVATGPALSPFNNSAVGVLGWLITKYDVFNRPIYTGWEESTTINNAGRVLKQNTMIGLTTLSESKTTTPTTIDSLTGIAYYTNSVAPTSFKLLTINYYDDYNFQVFSPVIAYTSPVTYNNSTLKPKGLPTGSWVRVLTTLTSTTGESSYILYDAKARAIKTFSTNYLGGYTQIVSNFNAFSERLNYTETRHKRVVGDPEIYVKDAYTYTIQDRLATHTHKIGTNGTIQLLASNTYDQLGQLISKKVGNTSTLPLQKVDYVYNIRGWLKGINNDPTNNLILNTTEKDLFAFKINYNTVENCVNYAGTGLYNGNISETYWRSASDNTQRKYGYKYDNLNRLRESIYQKPGLIAAQTLVTNAYDENITYDKNGNITSLNRKGNGDPQIGATVIDDLTYVYSSNTSNQLLKVTDSPSGNDYEGFIDANKTDDYTYDANVNLKTDANKGITEIIYNHLNLPTKITFGTKGTISYLYNSMGKKIEKTVYQAPKVNCGLKTIITTDYLSGFQYLKTANSSCTGKYAQPVVTLQFFPTAEGYVKNTAGVLSYVFNYTDHLGNVRVSYEKDAMTGLLKIIDENNYYPFGLKHTPYNDYTPMVKNMYKYNGKELQDELGLNFYDYGARNYDPALGRWMNIDPLAEKFPSWSPYNFCFNNPMRFVDPDGKEPTPAEAARMAAHVYGDKKNGILTGGWKVSSRDFGLTKQDLNNSSTGLKSQIYDRTVNGKTEYTYATAGTEASWKDVGADSKQPLGLSQQYEKSADNAKAISNILGSTELSFTGHSLGGGEAALNGLLTDRKAITFNAAGVSDITKVVEGNWKTPFKSEGNIDAYTMATDPLNTAQDASPIMPNVNGNRIYLIPTDASSIYNGHSMNNVLKNFGVAKPETYDKK